MSSVAQPIIAQQSGTGSANARRQLLRLEDDWAVALVKRDGAAFDEAAPAELLTLNEDSLSGLVVKTV